MDVASRLASDITVFAKYARYIPELGRRETWEEIVDRYQLMLHKKHPTFGPEIIDEACQMIRDKKVLPSMRALQFAGVPIERANSRLFNCGFCSADREGFFKEVMFLLLGGTGVGYSVQKHHVESLPAIGKPKKPRKWLVGDSIEGWADAINGLMRAFFRSKSLPVFDFSDVRQKGSRLVTAGGKAPGPGPLRVCLDQILNLLEAKEEGSKLEPWEVSDIACYIADAVLSGGIRRSAMIALFDIDDEHMKFYKSGSWWELNPQRGRANISAVANRVTTTKEQFDALWKATELSNAGEPGIFWTNDNDWGTNPCFCGDTLITTDRGAFPIKSLVGKSVNVWNGTAWQTVDNFQVTGTNQTLLKVTLQDGSEIRTTPYHKYILEDGKRVDATELCPGDKLSYTESFSTHGQRHEKAAYLKGFLLGEGTQTHGRPVLFLYEPKAICAEGLIRSAEELARGTVNTNAVCELGFRDNSSERQSRQVMTGLAPLKDELIEWVTENRRRLPSRAFAWDKRSKLEFIAGIFDSDGTASDTRNGWMYQLTSKSKTLLLDIQTLLKTIGVKSRLSLGHDAREAILPGGVYQVEATWRLTVAQAASVLLAKQVPFCRLVSFAEKTCAYIVKPRFNKVVSVEEDGIADKVYCCSVEGGHALRLAVGVMVGQCAEIALRDRQMCNLTTINFSTVVSQDDFEDRVKAATILGTLQAAFTDFHYLSSKWKDTCDEDALLGVSITGIADNPLFYKIDFADSARYAQETNAWVAERIGIKPSARITTTKPEGTASLVLGTSSGVHARHAKHYIRRFRFKSNEAIAQYLLKNCPGLIVEDQMGADTLILELPQKSPEGSVLRGENVFDFLERVKYLHAHWIVPGHIRGENTHNVSATASIKPEEWESVGLWMWMNRDSYTGLSVLPFDNGSYVQAPFEDCTEEEYHRRMILVREMDLTRVIEEDDETVRADQLACAGGSCEI